MIRFEDVKPALWKDATMKPKRLQSEEEHPIMYGQVISREEAEKEWGEFEDHGPADPEKFSDLRGRLSPIGWRPPEREMTPDEWGKEGRSIRERQRSSMWALGDWMNYPEQRNWGETYTQFIHATGLTYEYLAVLKHVARRFPIPLRLEIFRSDLKNNMGLNHFQKVASLDPSHARRLLLLAAENGWTREKLSEEVKNVRAMANAIADGADPDATMDETLDVAAGEMSLADAIKALRAQKVDEAKRKRLAKHAEIAARAEARPIQALTGPYPLLYVDPPWKFNTYSEKGLEHSPDRHYPTLTDDEIKAFTVEGKTVAEIADKDAALHMWCTTSNLPRALAIMEHWGFSYSTNRVWVKDRTGMGYVYLNQHELLLYGTRGTMPLPAVILPSVVEAPRGRHSEKPAVFRTDLERMYPAFNERSRVELFSRDPAIGWTCLGNEA